MFELRPVILETQGLRAALEYYVDRLITTEEMNIQLDIRNLDDRLAPQVEGLCFAIIQEAVSNVKKHANAENTWITVEHRTRDLVIAVLDDGKGFDVTTIERGYDRRGSMGMLNIKERAEMLDARHGIESTPGRGTLVYLIVPFPDQGVSPSNLEGADRESASPAGNGRRKRKTGPLHWPQDDRTASGSSGGE
jgi:signal transduction histidine kinase